MLEMAILIWRLGEWYQENGYQENQLLVNLGKGTFSVMIDASLPGGRMSTLSIALADINNGGLIDVAVTRNWQEKNQSVSFHVLSKWRGSFA